MRTHLLVEDGLSLTTVTGLLAHVTALSLDDLRVLALLVLRHLVRAEIRAYIQRITRAEVSEGRTCASCKSYPCNLPTMCRSMNHLIYNPSRVRENLQVRRVL